MKTLLFISIKNILTVVLIGFVGYFLFTNISNVKGLGQQINFIYLYLAIFFSILAINISAYKFKLTIDLSLNKIVLFKGWLEVFVKGYILNNLIPYSGVAYRGIYLKKHYGVSYTEYTVTCYIFGIIGLTLLLAIAALLLSFHHHAIIFITSIIILIILMKFKFHLFKKLPQINFRNHRINFYIKKLELIEVQLKKIINSNKRILFLLTFISSLCVDFLVYACVFISIHPSMPWDILLYIYLAYSLAWLIKLTPGNIGVQEILMGGLTSIVGLGIVSGITISMMLRIINLGTSLPVWLLSSVLSRK